MGMFIVFPASPCVCDGRGTQPPDLCTREKWLPRCECDGRGTQPPGLCNRRNGCHAVSGMEKVPSLPVYVIGKWLPHCVCNEKVRNAVPRRGMLAFRLATRIKYCDCKREEVCSPSVCSQKRIAWGMPGLVQVATGNGAFSRLELVEYCVCWQVGFDGVTMLVTVFVCVDCDVNDPPVCEDC